MSDHNERACTKCGSLTHHEDDCRKPSPLRLTDPDDATLNAAFAEHVARWTYWQSKHGHFHVIDREGNKSEPAYGWPAFDETTGERIERQWTDGVDLPAFTASADAVLPHLEKWGTWTLSFNLEKSGYIIELWQNHPGVGPEHGCPEPPSCEPEYRGESNVLAKAAVLAILRSKGVQVEFTK